MPEPKRGPGRPPFLSLDQQTKSQGFRLPAYQLAWLAAQPAGKSATLRRLIDQAIESAPNDT